MSKRTMKYIGGDTPLDMKNLNDNFAILYSMWVNTFELSPGQPIMLGNRDFSKAIRITSNCIDAIGTNRILFINREHTGYLYVNNGTSIPNGTIYCGTVVCSSSKPAIVETNTYGQTYMFSEESTHVLFNDDGSGVLDDNGECIIALDDRYLEMVTTSQSDYIVHLTGFKGANVEIEELQPTYFKVSGTPNKKFFWEVKAERKGFERLRYNEAVLEV